MAENKTVTKAELKDDLKTLAQKAQKKDYPTPQPLNVIYPDALAIFSFSPAAIADIVANGVIVLDTNALLVPYLTGRASLEEIKKTYTN